MTDLDVLRVIAEAPEPYVQTILDTINARRQPNWFTRRFPLLRAMVEMGPGGLYPKLSRLERDGFVWSELSVETYPERGNRRRRYYRLTDAGRTRLELAPPEGT